MIQIHDGDKHEALDIPLREGVPGYIGTFLSSWLNIQVVLKSPEFSTQPMRVYYMVEAIISMIPEEDNREKIRKRIDVLFDELKLKYMKETNTELLNEQQTNHIRILASLRTLGQTTDWVAKNIGIGYKNRVGYVKRKKEDVSVEIYQEDDEPEEPIVDLEPKKE